MRKAPETGRDLKKRAGDLLASGDLDGLAALPARKAASPLIGFLCSGDETIRWRAVEALGSITAGLFRAEPEAARVIVRRLLWMLSDESGGMGWGAAEAMGEILAQDAGRLACEFHRVLTSYLDPRGNLLDNPLLLRGAVWAAGRLAGARPDLAADAAPLLADLLADPDPFLRGLAAWALSRLAPQAHREALEALLADPSPLSLWENGALAPVTVAEMAARALAGIEKP